MGFLHSQLLVKPPYPTHPFTAQTVIVTGANTGLGKEAARHLARLGAAKLILAVRNTSAGETARRDIIASAHCSESAVEVWELDLSSYDSIKSFAERAKRELPRLDVLLENAGVALPKFSTSEGHERTVMVNVIGTFYLAILLLPLLQASAKKNEGGKGVAPRVCIVSSEVHGFTKFEVRKQRPIFPALDDEKFFSQDRYPESKLLEVLVVRALAPKLEQSGVVLNMLNPGLCHSELSRNGPWYLEIVKFLLARSTEVGSRTLVAAAAAGRESHGKYMSDGKVDEAALSKFVGSEEGRETAGRVWEELVQILEGVEEGVTKGLA